MPGVESHLPSCKTSAASSIRSKLQTTFTFHLDNAHQRLTPLVHDGTPVIPSAIEPFLDRTRAFTNTDNSFNEHIDTCTASRCGWLDISIDCSAHLTSERLEAKSVQSLWMYTEERGSVGWRV